MAGDPDCEAGVLEPFDGEAAAFAALPLPHPTAAKQQTAAITAQPGYVLSRHFQHPATNIYEIAVKCRKVAALQRPIDRGRA